jgi:ketosteroid isomerase-like protein
VDTASVAAAVEQWRGVWEGRDVSGYADMFHPEAAASRRSLGDTSLSAPRFTKVTLEARAANLFSQYARISVAVGALDIKRDGDLLVSSFDQDFTAWRSGSDSSPAYVDRGRKTLVFARDRSSEWRIVSEQWRSRSQ